MSVDVMTIFPNFMMWLELGRFKVTFMWSSLETPEIDIKTN